MKRGFLGQASNRVVDLSMTLWNSRKIFRPGRKGRRREETREETTLSLPGESRAHLMGPVPLEMLCWPGVHTMVDVATGR